MGYFLSGSTFPILYYWVMFRLWPYEKFHFAARMTPDNVLEKIQEYADVFNYPFGSWHKTDKPFQGKIEGYEFTLQKLIRYTNSFNPVITGSIAPGAGGSSISIVVRIPYSVFVFMALWIGFLGVFMTLFAVGMANSGFNAVSSMFVIIPLFMLFFGPALTIFGYNLERKKVLKFMREKLEWVDRPEW